MDNMDGSEMYGRVLTVNYAFPEKIKGGEQGWAAQPSMIALSLSLSICTLSFEKPVGFVLGLILLIQLISCNSMVTVGVSENFEMVRL